jgi:hypothetical protein
MKLRLFLSFALVVLVTILSMVLVVRFSAEREVRAWMFRGGMRGVESLVTELEDYYRSQHDWAGVENLFHSFRRGVGWRHDGIWRDGQLCGWRCPGSILIDTANPPS